MITIDSLCLVLLCALFWVLVHLVRAMTALTLAVKSLIWAHKQGESPWLQEG